MMPRLLDLFCGAGGCSVGYHRAGFEVVGVDINPQPNYPFEFYKLNALDALQGAIDGNDFGSGAYLYDFDAIHASPPCQFYAGSTAWRGNRDDHPDLIGPTQELLRATGLPYVLENVPDARRLLRDPLLLCGTGFGLRVRRHRYFELSWAWNLLMNGCHHRATDYSFDHGGKQPESVYRDAMGCEWMTVQESRQAIPPAYTELIGHQLIQQLTKQAA